MRIAMIATRNGPRAAAIRGSEAFVLADAGRGWPATMLELAKAGVTVLRDVDHWLASASGGQLLSSVRLLAPIANPSKIIAIGVNYADPEAPPDQQIPPAQPLVFAKLPSAIIGPGDPIQWDRSFTDQVDYEAELGVIIGHAARRVTEDDALKHVFGYTCINDVSARGLQPDHERWVGQESRPVAVEPVGPGPVDAGTAFIARANHLSIGKSLDTFCPMGPWIVTADEIPDPQALAISCTVSGEILQDSSTANMFFPVQTLISRLSEAMTLLPGDVIATGTPAGVGLEKTPPRLLRDGDEIVVSIERIGELRNPCAANGLA